jgi:L-ribulokinase
VAKIALGLDYGTNSVRALAVDTATGEELATAVFHYPSGRAGVLESEDDVHLARQHPADYIAGFVATVREIGRSVDLQQVVGIGFDTTGSSPMPVTADNRSLSQDMPGVLAAECWLWKDHASHAEAKEITELARRRGEPYLAKCGGIYSSEWWWSKILHCLRTSPEVFDRAASWVEICDWIPSVVCGINDPTAIKRSRCAAGHKAMFEEAWGGLPSIEFLNALDPKLGALRERLYSVVYTSEHVAGHLSADFAEQTGLPGSLPVAVGGFDAHFGAVASGASPGTLVKIIGTSTCDCMVHPLDEPLPDVPGMCGVVRGSVLPGFYGLEAGQSAVGDIFNWVSRLTGRSHEELTEAASALKPGQSGLLGLDWLNGNRTILVDPRLSGLFVGLNLHTTAPDLYRAAIEATAFGALRIIERMEQYGVMVERVVACGGIADKSALAMQIYADVFGRPVSIAKSDQTCALGSAIFASVAAGVYANVLEAQAKMAGVRPTVFTPDAKAHETYAELYGLYRDLHDQFGVGSSLELSHVMKKLLQIKEDSIG